MSRKTRAKHTIIAAHPSAPARSTVNAAILCALGIGVPTAYAADAETEGSDSGALETVMVTATKRAENQQTVPVAVEAISADSLQQQNIRTLDDYLRTLPTVRAASVAPGISEIYMRGIVSDAVNSQASSAQGNVPVVAVYLDEQSLSMMSGRNLDVYAADLERVEVLPGPQGTLYGASSMAGTIRLITNKPSTKGFEVGGTMGTAMTEGGAQSYSVQGFLNVPVTDQFAIRVVGYSDNQGGYIDNTLGSTAVNPATNPVIPFAAGTTYQKAYNYSLAKSNFNNASYTGDRISGRYEINDQWNVLIQHLDQRLKTDGTFDYDPTLGDLQVNRFFADSSEDVAHQTSWTVNGNLDYLDVIYTGAYLQRTLRSSVDYTGYNNVGSYIAYYTCSYATATDPNRHCLNPVKGHLQYNKYHRVTNELRVSSDPKLRIRGTLGAFLDQVRVEADGQDIYSAIPDLGFAQLTPPAGTCDIDPDTRQPGIGFVNCVEHKERQVAFFGEASVDLIPKSLILTGGFRHYDLTEQLRGASSAALGPFATEPFVRLYNKPAVIEKGTIPKGTLSWRITPDIMVYGTYSEGFRAGGLNRKSGPAIDPTYPGVPQAYAPDTLKNYEIGWKTELDDGRLRFNGDVYQINWSDMQIAVFDPTHVSNVNFIENAAKSRIRGIESDLSFAVTHELTLFGSLSYNDAKLISINSGVNGVAPVGSTLPLTPKFQGNIRARYEIAVNADMSVYAQAAMQYATSSYSALIEANRMYQSPYATVDTALGLKRDKYSVELYGQNVFDRRTQLFRNNWDDTTKITTTRPATFGARVVFDIK